MAKKSFTLRLDDSMRKKLESIADEKQISTSDVVRLFTEGGLSNPDIGTALIECQQQRKMLEKALVSQHDVAKELTLSKKQNADLQAAINTLGRALSLIVPVRKWIEADVRGESWTDAVYRLSQDLSALDDKEGVQKALSKVDKIKPGSCLEHWSVAAFSEIERRSPGSIEAIKRGMPALADILK